MDIRGVGGISDVGRANSPNLAEKMPRWSVTSTSPASMAARLGVMFRSCPGGDVRLLFGVDLTSVARFCGGETGALRLANAGTGGVGSGWSFGSGSTLSELGERFMIRATVVVHLL